MTYEDLCTICNELSIKNVSGKNQIILEIMKNLTEKFTLKYSGILEINDNVNFLRNIYNNCLPSMCDIHVNNEKIKLYNLKQGDLVEGLLLPYKSEKYFSLDKVLKVNNKPPQEYRKVFEELTAIHPDKQLKFEFYDDTIYSLITRVIDIFPSIGFGGKCLITAPPATGKTTILQSIILGIIKNYSNTKIKIVILLIDERCEEATEMIDMFNNYKEILIIVSTSDQTPHNHIRTFELGLEYCKRLVEDGETEVILLVDSITRVARAYNLVTESNKVSTGGVVPLALRKAKNVFCGRKIRNGVSCTVIVTALDDTGSKFDECLIEELKSIVTTHIPLSSNLSSKRVFPAIDVIRSFTRKKELFLSNEIVNNINALISFINNVKNEDIPNTIKNLFEKIKSTKDNIEFFNTIMRN